MLGKQEPVLRGPCWNHAAGLEVTEYMLENEATHAVGGVKVVVSAPSDMMQVGRDSLVQWLSMKVHDVIYMRES